MPRPVAHSLDWYQDDHARQVYTQVVADWHPKLGRLAIHGLELSGSELLLFTDPEPAVGFREACAAALEVDPAGRVAWAASRVVELCRALEGFAGPHRDVSPRCFGLTDDGLSLLYPPISAIPVLRMQVTGRAEISRSGAIAYMSPEGVRGASISPASDVYQLGMMLRALLGAPPASVEALTALQAILDPKRPPPLRELGLAIPPALDELLARTLSLDVSARPETPSALATELAPFATETEALRADLARRARLHVRAPFRTRFERAPIVEACKKTWNELTPTEDPSVRDCADCKHSVHRVTSVGALIPLQGRCVRLEQAATGHEDLTPLLRPQDASEGPFGEDPIADVER